MTTITHLVFNIICINLVIAAIMVITTRTTIHSVFYLILVFIQAAALLIMLEAEYLAMILLIVYVGAIAVLFLFVVMMLEHKPKTGGQDLMPIAYLVGLIFFVEILLILFENFYFLQNLVYTSYVN